VSSQTSDPTLDGFLSSDRLIRPRALGARDGKYVLPDTGSAAASDTSVALWTSGTGTPRLDRDRTGPSTLLAFGDDLVLVDSGSGCGYRLAQLGIDPGAITAIFITHHHVDHNSDLPFLLIAPWVYDHDNYRAPVIVGPRGTAEFVARLFALQEYDIRARIPHGYDVDRLSPLVVEPADQEIVSGLGWTARAFQVDHSPVQQALGYRFSVGDLSIGISGDTRPSSNLVATCQHVDVLIHEVIFPGYGLPTYHTLSHEVGVVAHKCRAKRLVLTHLLPGDISSELWQEHAALGFNGDIDVAYDLMKVL
jgi:ribonuclease Z